MHVRGKCARPSSFVMDLPIWFDNLIMHLIEKEPDKRPMNAAKVAEELESIAKKVQDQTSAGLERVSKRRADRTTLDHKLDATDKEIGRSLLGKKKKKGRAQPIYAKGWFTLSALGAALVAVGLGVYFLFLKPPNPDTLYREADRLMKSASLDDHRQAAKEPIHDFLRYHPDDPRAGQVKAWRSRYELEMCQWYVTHDRKSDDDPAGGWQAVAAEREGRLDDAIKQWDGVVKLKDDADPDRRGWGSLAEKSLVELKAANELHRKLAARVAKEKDKTPPSKTDPEALTLDVLRSQAGNDRKAAIAAADELKRVTEGMADERPYYLLALKLRRELQ
jgi:hypothetical protein